MPDDDKLVQRENLTWPTEPVIAENMPEAVAFAPPSLLLAASAASPGMAVIGPK